MDIMYTARATATGGREGHVESSDGLLKLDLLPPKEMGGPADRTGTNPEQLFAAGYAACFHGALGVVARRHKVSIEGSSVTGAVGIGKNDSGGFALAVELIVNLPGVEPEQARQLVEEAHQVCPYSNATRGNIDVKLTVA
ncbi:Ohr subfamily peroxiredoxin [Deinobacterium chartae]|uniref:Ohr subfamily peroxiredoxin n=1 Tax=Deinobacterium chartae TaxID=521158 RepID=A0A841I0F9_9DEIO|nr:organic hydroperoxide resistance protein [Deinobacterium chartae]MBB6099271.1 Ohr subfamily peroxiredoxin [Deinobacterium chartae]